MLYHLRSRWYKLLVFSLKVRHFDLLSCSKILSAESCLQEADILDFLDVMVAHYLAKRVNFMQNFLLASIMVLSESPIINLSKNFKIGFDPGIGRSENVGLLAFFQNSTDKSDYIFHLL